MRMRRSKPWIRTRFGRVTRSPSRFGQRLSRRELKGRKHAVLRVTRKLLGEAFATGEVQTPAQMSDAGMRSLLAGISVGMRGMRKPERIARKAVKVATDAGTETLIALIDDNGSAWVLEMERLHRGFAERLDERWGGGIRLCELVRIVCLEVGIEHHKEWAPKGGARHHVLSRLHARACQIAGEVLVLMRNGYASGAHARWRALHEITVIGTFIADRDEDLAERYLAYEHVESLAAARDYQRNAEELGYERLPDAEIADMKLNVDQLCGKYGAMFKKRYGWAAHVFGRVPDYRTVELATELSHYRSYYRMASHPIHAGPKGIAFDIGQVAQGSTMPAGPSNAGLADPGQGLCISLTQITAAFLNLETAAGNAVTIRTLLDLSEKAGDALMLAHRQLEEDDSRVTNEASPTEVDGLHPDNRAEGEDLSS
jgi:Family of unknown function (DUF5677)